MNNGKTRKQQIEDMLAETPDDIELRYMLAMEYISAGDDEAAVRCFAELLQRDANYPPAYHMQARTLARLGRTDQARAALRLGIPIAQKRGDAHAAGEMMELLDSLE